MALVPASIIWGVQYGFAANFADFWRFSANLWLMGHGADVTVAIDPTLAANLGLAGGTDPIRFTIALLGFALLTVQLALRAGRRASLADSPLTSLLAATGTTAVLAALITLSAASAVALPSRPQGVLFPTLIVGVAMTIGVVLEQRRTEQSGWLEMWAERLRWQERLSLLARRDIAASLAGGLAIVAGILAVAGLGLALMLVLNYATVVGLYQSLQGGILGGSVLTLGQLVFLPNLVIWAAAWIVGAGFSIGTGSSISPAGTVVGPVPALPVFGALPEVTGTWGFVVLLVPVLLGFFIAMVLRQRHDRFSSPARAAVVLRLALGLALVCAGILALLSWWAGGAMGPARLQTTGPDPWMVAAWSGVTVFLGAAVGGFAGRLGGK